VAQPTIPHSPPIPGPEELLRLFEISNDLLAIIEGEHFVQFNSTWEATLGWSPDELTARPVFSLIHPDDVERTAALAGAEGAEAPDVVGFENRWLCRDGSYRWLLWSARSDGERWYAVAKDVTERRGLEEEARRDPLTGLANRAAITKHLEESLERTAGRGAVIVAFADVDHLKPVNDAFGHDVGDQLLASVAKRLMGAVRDIDLVSRFGGDEFVVVVERFSDPGEPEELAERLAAVFRQPFEIGGEEMEVGVSIGVAQSRPRSTPDELLREADTAMYRAKSHAGASWSLFDERARREVAEHQEKETDLRRVLERDELLLHYQPVVSLQDGVPVGWEALVRWRHHERGLVPPMEFIPLAELNGQIVPIGQWIFEEACRQARRWRETGWSLTMAINVSPRQLERDDFAQMIKKICYGAGLPAQVICLELTESSLLEDLDRAAPVLEQIRRMGMRIAIDDFGSGSSSLSYLKSLPVDVIKIDRMFTHDLGNSLEDRAVVSAVISLADTLGISVIAEGVEDERQAQILRELGCPLAQGFLFAKPEPADQVDLGGSSAKLVPGLGDPSVIREFMRQIGIPARMDP
jgi:diguanylate cyclase (GGDEF)-like protein/PAS domain S-box-containing protein